MKTSNLAEITQTIRDGKPLTGLLKGNAQLSAQNPIRKAIAQIALTTVASSSQYLGLEDTIIQIQNGAKLNDLEFSQLVAIRKLEAKAEKITTEIDFSARISFSTRKQILGEGRRMIRRTRSTAPSRIIHE